MAVKELLKRSAYRLAPRWAAELDQCWWLRRNARDLSRQAAGCRTPAELLAALNENGAFPASQQPGEILRLMEMVGELRPRHALEIGTRYGGTLFLLAQMC